MSEKITYEMLLDAAKAGGSSALSEVTRLEPAGGPQALVAPAKYSDGNRATYVFETRYLSDGEGPAEPVKTVLIDSRTSEANRIEQALLKGIEEGQPTLSKMPRMVVEYEIPDELGNVSMLKESDLELPHRAFDAHFRLGTQKEATNKSFIQDERYVAARNATPNNAGALFELSPITVLLGGWDSTRKSHQARFASCVTGEIIGVLSDQEANPEDLVTHRSGARIDPVGAGFYFSQDESNSITSRLGVDAVSPKKRGGKISGSAFVLGSIPPSAKADALDGISVKNIVRSRVLSFATLRSLSFGYGAEGDQAVRALLAAVAIDGMARADADLFLRANAHLVEAERPAVVLYQRYGEKLMLEPIDVADADALLDEAYKQAHEDAKIVWDGQEVCVKGDPAVINALNDAASEE